MRSYSQFYYFSPIQDTKKKRGKYVQERKQGSKTEHQLNAIWQKGKVGQDSVRKRKHCF